MTYFFESQERQDKLGSILEEWVGTPFRHKCGVKGLGCDCIHFVGKVFEEFELVDFNRVKIPDYPRDWHLHNKKEQLAESIINYFDVEQINFKNNETLMNGDIILFHYGKAASHAGIFYKDRIYHSLLSVRKVTTTPFSDKRYRRMMRFFFRVKDIK